MDLIKDGKVIAKENQRTKLIKFSRVVGFIRPVNSFNDGKQQEFKERTAYDIDKRTY